MAASAGEIISISFTADDMAALEAEGGSIAANSAAMGEVSAGELSHDGDGAAYKASHIEDKGYNSIENAVRLNLGTALPAGKTYIISAWLYVPDEG